MFICKDFTPSQNPARLFEFTKIYASHIMYLEKIWTA